MSVTQYTFGGSYNRGNAILSYDTATGKWAVFPTDDLANPTVTTALQYRPTLAFGKDKILHQVYSTRPYVNEQRYFEDRPLMNYCFQDTTQVESISNNYPYTISFGNDMWMSLPYRTSSIAGDVRTSPNGSDWTTHSGVLPAISGFVTPAIYNSDDDRWVTCDPGTTSIYYSDDDGQTWSTATSPRNVYQAAYGNNTWVFSSNGGYVVRSTNNLSSFSSVNVSSTNYSVNFNEWDQTFFLPAGTWSGSQATGYTAKVLSSTDGNSWTTRYSGTAPFFGLEITGDDSGNYVMCGQQYLNSAWVATNSYLYSTNSGVSWTAGTMPESRKISFSSKAMAWGSLKRGNLPSGTPLPAGYDVEVNTTSVTENSQTITWTINTTNVADATTLYYSLTPFPTDGYSDFTDANYNGSMTINSNTATVTRTTQPDQRTEGTDTVALELRVNSVSGPIVSTSDAVTITDTSQSPPPPSKAQPSVTSGATQSGSVPRSVVNTEEFAFSFQLTNSTPYSYTVDLKFKEDFLNENAGDIGSTFTINSLTVGTVNGTLNFPTGYDKDEAPNFNFTYLVDARGAPGTPDEVDFVVSRTPYSQSFSPPSGSNAGRYTQYSPSNPYQITVSGGEPNSMFNWQGTNNNQQGTSQFNGSGVAVVDVYQPNSAGTFNYIVTWQDLSTDNYTIVFTN